MDLKAVPDTAGTAEDSAEYRVVHLLAERGRTLAVAESCTGGLIGHLLTNVTGSSRCFIGGVVAYHNEAKMSLLAVPAEILRIHGSVSRETALAMARGARDRLDSDVAIGVTGIAGPGGGSPEKPVGTVYFALVDRNGRTVAIREQFQGSREVYKDLAAARALRLIEEHLALAADN